MSHSFCCSYRPIAIGFLFHDTILASLLFCLSLAFALILTGSQFTIACNGSNSNLPKVCWHLPFVHIHHCRLRCLVRPALRYMSLMEADSENCLYIPPSDNQCPVYTIPINSCAVTHHCVMQKFYSRHDLSNHYSSFANPHIKLVYRLFPMYDILISSTNSFFAVCYHHCPVVVLLAYITNNGKNSTSAAFIWQRLTCFCAALTDKTTSTVFFADILYLLFHIVIQFVIMEQ